MDNLKSLGGAALAYVGDAVLEIFVREKLIKKETDTGKLSAMAQAFVSTGRQSEKVDALLPLLDEDETAIYHLGRNYKAPSKPRHASVVEYHRASGLEAVFGYLHLSGNDARARELFDKIYGEEMT